MFIKRIAPSAIIGGLLALIFACFLFLFQVRQTEVAVVTTFGRFSRSITEPGLNVRWPWPIQKIYKFDNRIVNFERRFEQTTTADGRSVLVSVFIGWHIDDPRLFMERLVSGDKNRVEQNLEGIVRDTKNAVIGAHPFGDLVSTNKARVRLNQIEQEMLASLHSRVRSNYGIAIDLLGIQQIGLPESITTKVFDRMRAERQRLVKQFQNEGEAEAIRIRSEADRIRQESLAQAEAQATILRGQGEAEAAKSYVAFEQNPELAMFLIQINALGNSLKTKATLVLDPQTPPFSLLGANATVSTNVHIQSTNLSPRLNP